MKRIWKALLAAMLLALLAAPALADTDYKERAVTLFRQGEPSDETLTLRFYSDFPSVPCMGLRAFYREFLEMELDWARGEDGTILLTSDAVRAVADPAAGWMRVDDMTAFVTGVGERESDAIVGDVAFVKVVESVVDRPAEPFTMDFARYGIPLIEDGEELFLPLATLSDIFADYGLCYVSWNGENVYYVDESELFMLDASEDQSAYFAPVFAGMNRAADMADFAYREICFNIDHFYGFPGAGEHESDVLELGLDGALEKLDPKTRDYLRSEQLPQYVVGLYRLFNHFLDDNGHTGFAEYQELMNGGYPASAGFTVLALFNDESYSEAHSLRLTALLEAGAAQADALQFEEGDDEAGSAFTADNMVSVFGLTWERARRTYAEWGDTAVFSPQVFAMDYEGWRDYYENGGPMPLKDDTLACMMEALQRASANPEIRNFVIDLSVNYGGDTSASLPILALLTGDGSTVYCDRLTGQRVEERVAVDFNFDGTLDDADAEAARYDFNYAAIISRGTFSAANEMAVRLKERGIPLLGETSGGGSCAIQICATADGMHYQMSSPLQLLWADGESVEGGAEPDIPLVETIGDGERDYSGLYDLELLSESINAWYLERGGYTVEPAQPPEKGAAVVPLDEVFDALGDERYRQTYEALLAGAVIEKGTKGDFARDVQRTLIAFGQDISADGDVGKKTLGALNAVQAAFGLEQTGTLDAAGYAQLMPRLLICLDGEKAEALLKDAYSDKRRSEYSYMAACALTLQGRYYSARRLFIESKWEDWNERAAACVQPWPEDGRLWRNSKVGGGSVELIFKVKGDPDTAMLVKIYKADGTLAACLFIDGSGKASVSLPSGTYVIKDGYGSAWYGMEEAFGREGVYETMLFDGGEEQVKLKSNYRYTITIDASDSAGGKNGIGSEQDSWSDF